MGGRTRESEEPPRSGVGTGERLCRQAGGAARGAGGVYMRSDISLPEIGDYRYRKFSLTKFFELLKSALNRSLVMFA